MFIIRAIYYLLVFLCIGISLFLTYYGFEKTFLQLTIWFTAVIGLLLFAADYLMQQRRERGDSWAPAFMLFLLAAAFSSISNFNYLYTNFMTGDVLSITIREQYQVFSDDLTSTRTSLGSQTVMQNEQDRRDSLETELSQMWVQMNDPARVGCGERCAGHIVAINALLGVAVTDLARPDPSSSERERTEFYGAFRNLVLEAQETSGVSNAFGRIRNVIAQIEERLAFYGDADDALRAGVDLSILSQLSDDSLRIERVANAVLPADQEVEHRKIDPTLGRLGEIPYSLHNGFVEVPSLSATIMAAILSIVVDFVPILFAFVAFRPGEFNPDPSEDDYDLLDGGF